MKAQPTKLEGWLVRSASVVYREVSARARLLVGAVRGDEPAETLTDDTLAAYAEPATLPEPLLRSKVG